MVVFRGGKTITDSAQVLAGVIQANDLATDAVETLKIKDGNVTKEKIAAAAGIEDSKLATISTAGKVSGAALTLLGNIPAGGGSVPTANIAQLPALGTAPSPARQTAIVNAEIDAAAAIVDTKLAQIATGGKVSGAALTSLASIPAGAGTIPAANLPATGLTYKNGTATKNAADADAVQNIAHGLGATPKKIKITAIGEKTSDSANANITITVYNGTTQSSISKGGSSATGGVNTNFAIGMAVSDWASNHWTVGVVTWDATNIIITWTKTGSPTGVYTLLWEAEV